MSSEWTAGRPCRRLREVASVAGRYTQVERRGRQVRLLLAKNPAGWLEAFDVLDAAAGPGAAVGQRPGSPTARTRPGSGTWTTGCCAAGRCTSPGSAASTSPSGWKRTWSRSSSRTGSTTRSTGSPRDRLDVIANYTAFQQIRVGAAAGRPDRGGGHAPPTRGSDTHRGPSGLRLVWVYPDLLSTYGDRGNLLVLERRARLRGLAVESINGQRRPAGARAGGHLPDGRR